MSEIKHTPGPWRIEAISNEPIPGAVERKQYNIWSSTACAIYPDKTFIARVASGLSERNKLNAQLIAAAPDLLEALKEFRQMMDGANDPTAPALTRTYTRACEAISKAEGNT